MAGIRRIDGAILAVLLLSTAPVVAGGRSVSVTTEGDRVETCDDIQVRFGTEHRPLPVAREERHVGTIDRARIETLTLRMTDANGVYVRGWDRDAYDVTACIAAGAPQADDADAILRDVSVSLTGGRAVVKGPDSEDWLVYLLVRVPRGAALDLGAENGPLGLREVSGQVRASVENGPIGLDRCAGDVEVQAQNGPISVDGGGGRHRLQATNGPISIVLRGARWDGGGLDAHAENGPLSLKVPDGYASGVRAEASRHAPVQCSGSACDQARHTWSDDHLRLELGSGPTAVRVATVNGPLSVKARGGATY